MERWQEGAFAIEFGVAPNPRPRKEVPMPTWPNMDEQRRGSVLISLGVSAEDRKRLSKISDPSQLPSPLNLQVPSICQEEAHGPRSPQTPLDTPASD